MRLWYFFIWQDDMPIFAQWINDGHAKDLFLLKWKMNIVLVNNISNIEDLENWHSCQNECYPCIIEAKGWVILGRKLTLQTIEFKSRNTTGKLLKCASKMLQNFTKGQTWMTEITFVQILCYIILLAFLSASERWRFLRHDTWYDPVKRAGWMHQADEFASLQDRFFQFSLIIHGHCMSLAMFR